MRSAALIVVLALAAHPTAAPQIARSGAQPPAAEKLPPLSYTCPMHPEILEDKKGTCPICKMDLVPIRLDSVWSCPVHSVIAESKAGTCPIDGRELIQVTVAVSWACPGSTTDSASPGTCPDGSAMARKTAPRAHGNHNPQHGGQFFMAADNWHHLEGAYLPTGTFRMYFYDDYTKPLPLAALRDIKAQLVAKDSRTGKDTTYSLVRSGRFLQATIGKLPLPAEMYAKVKFKAADAKDHRFDFTFAAYSREPHGTPAATMTNASPAAAATPAAAAATTAELASGVDPALVPLPIPGTVPEMLAQLKARTDQVGVLIDRGTFAAIYVPAFQAKDLALALDEHKGELTPERRAAAEPAIARLVRFAYMLDAFGDIGNKQQITDAYARFVEAANNIHAAFPNPQAAIRNPQ